MKAMKTKFRNLGTALVLAIAITGVNATEVKSAMDFASDPKMEIETWMTNPIIFDAYDKDASSETVVDIAVANPDFSILVEAVTKADLVGALSADGPFTIFAPTNDAFSALFGQLGVSGIEDLTADQLTPILTYHVVSGKVMSDDLSNTEVATLNGSKLEVNITDGVKINDSNVIKADIEGKNGVIHVIDKVLIPN